MRVVVGYAPLHSERGIPLLSQNRQFQWFTKPTFVYPMVPASAATLLKADGHDVLWLDGIAERLTDANFDARFSAFDPDLFLLETKTPVVKQTWRVVERLKTLAPRCRIVLCGDHVTALPGESLANSKADYILRGGDYDFSIRALARHLENTAPENAPAPPSPTAPMPAGIWWRGADGSYENSGDFDLSQNKLDDLPPIDRDLTRWDLYSRENGNFRATPGTYTMAGRDCWWGKCRFCSWTTIYNNWRVQSPEKVLDEIGSLIEKHNVKEIFDDTGCFPAGAWLRQFCEGMIARGYHKKVVMGCNMIPGAVTKELYELMAKAGFSFVLFGLESASEATLDRIRKCPTAKNIEESVRLARAAGLRPHVTCMVGYPWESLDDAKKTVAMTRSLFDKGWIETLQGTIVIPYPGTPLFEECGKHGWLKTEDWDRYDMREPIMKTSIPDAEMMSLVRGLYTAFMSPKFIFRQIASIRSFADFAFLWKAGLRVLGHLADFGGKAKG